MVPASFGQAYATAATAASGRSLLTARTDMAGVVMLFAFAELAGTIWYNILLGMRTNGDVYPQRERSRKI